MPTYTHAKDFLIEFAEKDNTQGWLKDLIIKIINSNGKLEAQDIDASKEQLKSNGASLLGIPVAPAANASSVVRFRLLEHKSGVCALAPSQKIRFSDEITLIYGSNGSGKSSYFRILNEIVGGNREIPLRTNIFSPSNVIEVEVSYTENGTERSFIWGGTTRAIEPLNLASVFDTGYSSTFLERRSADEAIVMPYGLHLFTSLTLAMDSIKGRVETEVDSIERTLPAISLDKLSDDIKRIINQRHYTSAQRKAVERLYSISESELSTLTELEKTLKQLVQTNYDDKIKIAKSEKQQLADILSHIKEIFAKISSIAQGTRDVFIRLTNARKASEAAKARIAILAEIGNTDNPEWKNFVASGDRFAKASTIGSDICPYCRQPLTNEASNILAAYSDFLADKTQSVLTAIVEERDLLRRSLDQTNTSYKITEQQSRLLESFPDYPTLKEDVQKSLAALSQNKSVLEDCFNMETPINEENASQLSLLINNLQKVVVNYDAKITELSEAKSKHEEHITAIRRQMLILVEHKAISSQSALFQDWFAKMDGINELKRCARQLSTRPISSLARVASLHLVTDNLRVKFQEELDAMGLKKLQVDLSEASASRGRTFMQIHLNSNAEAKEILSEGEQKGVALALFIAERRMQQTSNPIILDDPVNSLDHLITGKFIERLVKLNNQIIIFSHNILLRTTLLSLNDVHECGNNQLASCNKKSKHLFLYKVQSQGRDLKGVVTEGKQENVKNHLRDAKIKLEVIPFQDFAVVTASLRQAIELMIDEVILNNQVPVKFHGKKNNIQWDQLKNLKPDVALIDKLKVYYGRLSGGSLHAGIEQAENPIEYDELKSIYDDLGTVCKAV